MGAFFWENPNPYFRIQKRILRVFWQIQKQIMNPYNPHSGVDSSDQIQIRIFEIHNLNVFWGKDLKKVFLTSGFLNKNGTQQVPYMYDILTEPIYIAGALTLSH